MPKSRHDPSRPDRRSVVFAGVALVGAAAIPDDVAQAAELGLAPATDLLGRLNQFLSRLEPDQRKAASFAWDGPEWRGWNYFGSSDFIKPGLRLEQMSASQKEAAWDVLATVLSPGGLEKARNVMTLQDVLAAQGNGTGVRSSERFSFAVFGVPADSGRWGFRFEGHHLSQSIAVQGGRIISVTPSSFSANPNRVTAGKHAGLITLKAEEALARRLYRDLAPNLSARARLSETALSNILSYAGRERANGQKAGIAAAQLAPAQRDLLWQLIESLCSGSFAAAACHRTESPGHVGRSGGRAFRVVRTEHT